MGAKQVGQMHAQIIAQADTIAQLQQTQTRRDSEASVEQMLHEQQVRLQALEAEVTRLREERRLHATGDATAVKDEGSSARRAAEERALKIAKGRRIFQDLRRKRAVDIKGKALKELDTKYEARQEIDARQQQEQRETHGHRWAHLLNDQGEGEELVEKDGELQEFDARVEALQDQDTCDEIDNEDKTLRVVVRHGVRQQQQQREFNEAEPCQEESHEPEVKTEEIKEIKNAAKSAERLERKYAAVKHDLRGTAVGTRSQGTRRAPRSRDVRKVRGRSLNAQYRQSARARRELVLEGTRKFSHKSLKLTTAQCKFAHAHGAHTCTRAQMHTFVHPHT